MSKKPLKQEDKSSEIFERSKEEIIDEEIKNQQTIDIFLDTEKNWS
tara:strand:- start:662 stop:799 length:138 start_codon:yes stop_codon:yes gene_type:complete